MLKRIAYLIPPLIGLMVAVMVYVGYRADVDNHAQKDHARVLQVLNDTRANLEASLGASVHLVDSMEAFLKVDPTPSRTEFEVLAGSLMRDIPAVRSLMLAQGDVVTHIFPRLEEGKILGRDLSKAGPMALRTLVQARQGDRAAPDPRPGAALPRRRGDHHPGPGPSVGREGCRGVPGAGRRPDRRRRLFPQRGHRPERKRRDPGCPGWRCPGREGSVGGRSRGLRHGPHGSDHPRAVRRMGAGRGSRRRLGRLALQLGDPLRRRRGHHSHSRLTVGRGRHDPRPPQGPGALLPAGPQRQVDHPAHQHGRGHRLLQRVRRGFLRL